MESDSELNAELSASSGLFKGIGIVLMILGVIAIIFPWFASLAVVTFAGWVLVIGALFIFGSAFMIHVGGTFVRILWSLVALIAGVILLVNTDGSVGFLTAVLAIYFIIAGLVKVTVAATNRGQSGAGWIAVNGILSLIIGLIIIADISNTKDWAIGLLHHLASVQLLALSGRVDQPALERGDRLNLHGAIDGEASLLTHLLTKDWAIGLLLGIDFIFAGFTLIMIGTRAKQLSQEP